MSSVGLKKLEVSTTTKGLAGALILVGIGSFLGIWMKDPTRAWAGYLVSFFFFTSLGLGGLFFTAIQHVSKAGWSVTVRRVSESFTGFLPIAALGGLFLLVGAPKLYEWLHVDVVAKDVILQKKVAYLNYPFFIIRTVLFFGLWIFFAKKIVGLSLKQDETGDSQLTLKSVPYSIAFIMVFALSYSFFSVDTMMSLHPHWFSTMFGVYTFAGLFQSSLAMLILFVLYLIKKGLLKDVVTIEHIHDLGKFMFAFTVFYAYIAFSQFMLIWYANLPEETIFFLHRAHDGWMSVSMSLLVFKFIVPFIVLMSRHAKRNTNVLASICVLLLIMQYVDNYWLVYPNFNEGHVVFSFWEVGIFLGFLGLFLFAVLRFLSNHSVIAAKDPRLHEALHHHT